MGAPSPSAPAGTWRPRWMVFSVLPGALLIAMHDATFRLIMGANDAGHLSTVARPTSTACTYERLRKATASDVAWEPQAGILSKNASDLSPSPYRLRISTCELDHYLHAGPARACLGGRHLVFVGDSLTRYTYLNFVNYLEHGVWEGPHPSNEVETEWPAWNDFYNGTSARLNGHEVCDCYRAPGRPMQDIVENRYYYNPTHDTRASYIQLFMHDWGTRGHNRTWLGDPLDGRVGNGHDPASPPAFGQRGCLPGACDGRAHPFHWKQGVIESLEGHIADMEPDVVIFNSGLWEAMPGKLDVHRLVAAGHMAVAKKCGKMFFRTTTTTQDANSPADADRDFAAIVESYGWRVLDAGLFTLPLRALQAQTRSAYGRGLFYWDAKHFYPSVYAGLNQLMLNMLCDPQW